MLIPTLQHLFERDLNKLKLEINTYQNESNLWVLNGEISNSAGNLSLHLIGNLNTYIGAALGKTDYVRNRELEFSLKNVAREEIISILDATIILVKKVLSQLNEADLNAEFPILVFEKPTTTGFLLIHLTTHLAYHLGQINYHRRFLDK
jgi:uncharacterized damage-inducible protein DinB